MNNRTKTAHRLTPGDVVAAYPDPQHPDRHGTPGEWEVTSLVDGAERVAVGYREGHAEGVWVLPRLAPVQVLARPATDDERAGWIAGAGMTELVRLASKVSLRAPDLFDEAIDQIEETAS